MTESVFDRALREDNEALLNAACALVNGYRALLGEPGARERLDGEGALGERFREIESLGLVYDRLLCQCCRYGNHDIRCTCDGEGCCHPEAWRRYGPDWGHGNGWRNH